METPESLSWEEQVALLKEQGMEIYDSDAETLKQKRKLTGQRLPAFKVHRNK